MKNLAHPILLFALVATAHSMSLEKEFEIEDLEVRMAAMESGCFNRNRSFELFGKQGLTNEGTRWPGGVVPVDFDRDAKWTRNEMRTIINGLKLISDNTCVSFVRRRNEKNFISIQNKEQGCWSYMGSLNNGSQALNLHRDGCVNSAITAHEVMHALGIAHEQSRTDRDDYIVVHYENIQDGMKYNFDIQKNSSPYGLPYDFDSIMHYFRTAFSKNDQPTMSSKVAGREVSQYGNYDKPTEKDLQLIRIMYNC